MFERRNISFQVLTEALVRLRRVKDGEMIGRRSSSSSFVSDGHARNPLSIPVHLLFAAPLHEGWERVRRQDSKAILRTLDIFPNPARLTVRDFTHSKNAASIYTVLLTA